MFNVFFEVDNKSMARTKKFPDKIDIPSLTEEAFSSDDVLREYIANLGCDSRHSRQISANVLHEIVLKDKDKIEPFIPEILDALNRPERQTRWECLDILSVFAETHTKECLSVLEQAETALFDETSGILRFSAFDFVCKVGACSPSSSKKMWPLIDEAVQCYHGNAEFYDMLNSLVQFSKGKLDKSVKEHLAELVRFDAENAKGSLQSKTCEIISNCENKSKKKSPAKKGK